MTDPPTPSSSLTLIPARGGLDVAGSGGREIGFGRARAGALASVARVEGAVPEGRPCPAPGLDAVETESGIILVFAAARFVGWEAGGASAGRRCGIVPAS